MPSQHDMPNQTADMHAVDPGCGTFLQAHSTENLYRAIDSALTRVSDDFYPREKASHTVHLAVCASNALFIGPLLLPDWVRWNCRPCHSRVAQRIARRCCGSSLLSMDM